MPCVREGLKSHETKSACGAKDGSVGFADEAIQRQRG